MILAHRSAVTRFPVTRSLVNGVTIKICNWHPLWSSINSAFHTGLEGVSSPTGSDHSVEADIAKMRMQLLAPEISRAGYTLDRNGLAAPASTVSVRTYENQQTHPCDRACRNSGTLGSPIGIGSPNFLRVALYGTRTRARNNLHRPPGQNRDKEGSHWWSTPRHCLTDDRNLLIPNRPEPNRLG